MARLNSSDGKAGNKSALYEDPGSRAGGERKLREKGVKQGRVCKGKHRESARERETLNNMSEI